MNPLLFISDSLVATRRPPVKGFLIPPQRVKTMDGLYEVPDEAAIGTVFFEADRLPVLQLIHDLEMLGIDARLSSDRKRASIAFRRVKSGTRGEGYTISVAENGIVVAAATDAGIFYGAQTLREMLRIHGRQLPCVSIEDWPDLARRGVYLDCSRGKVPAVETVKSLIERLAHWKINELQLYVENVFTFAKHPKIGKDFSPFSPQDLLSIREHCKLYHVEFVPSLTSLGHFEKILMLDEYKDFCELPGFRDLPGGTTLCPIDPRSIALVDDLYGEFLPLFTANDFNVCGDEPWELGQGKSRQAAEEIGTGKLYLNFILELHSLCIKYGKRMNMWGDIVLKYPEIIPEIPNDIVLLNWDYTAQGRMMQRTDEFSRAGLPLVCCPGTNSWQSHGTRLFQGFEDISSFAGIAVEHEAEGLLNTDWGDGGHRNTLGVSLHGFAFGGANAWNAARAGEISVAEFLQTFAADMFRSAEKIPGSLMAIGDDSYGVWAYHVLFEKISAPEGLGNGFARGSAWIDTVDLDEEAMAKLAASADNFELPGMLQTGTGHPPDDFEISTLEEYALANAMNKAALDRVRLSRIVRSGGKPEKKELEIHLEQLQQIRADFERLWLKRSKPSRLADNLAGFEAATVELREMI